MEKDPKPPRRDADEDFNGDSPPQGRPRSMNGWWLIFGALAVFLIFLSLRTGNRSEISYQEFEEYVDRGLIEEVQFTTKSARGK